MLKWYCVKLKDETHMIVSNVKSVAEAEIVAQAHIIRNRLDLTYDVENIFEINGYHDVKLIGAKSIVFANT